MAQNRVKLINCNEEILNAILQGDGELAALLNIRVPEKWSEFGYVAFKYSLEAISKNPKSQKWLAYLPIDTGMNTLLGSCGFKGVPDKNGYVEIGYEVAQQFRNKGYATEITRLLTAIAFEDPEVKTVVAHTLAEENASVKVLKKNGFTHIEELYDAEDGLIWRWEKIRKTHKSDSGYLDFETDRLILRPTIPADAPFILELLNTPKFLKFIGDRKVKTIDQAEQYIKDRILPQLERLGYANYTLIRKSDGAKIGTCGLYDREGLDGIDIGFAFLPQYERMGYAFESAAKLQKAAFEIFGIKKLSAITTRENTSSQKLIEKLGLNFKEMIKLPDDDADLMLYTLEI
ncbi:MAG: GNAT family N-acetyltransferase [Flavobacteriaceae bacterium]|nr:GNAT family N-acetyltransferase [Flavobacteriaceae bacterium]